MSEEPDNSGIIRNPDGTFPKGVSGNPAGRPKGSFSIKDEIRKYLDNNPEEVKKIVAHFVQNNRELMWQMLEGRPRGDDKLELDLPQNIIDLIKHADQGGSSELPTKN